jgi:hypothetical protein
MRTKVVHGRVYFKRNRYLLVNDKTKVLRFIEGHFRVVEKHGKTYVVMPIGFTIDNGLLVPIREDYDLL